MDHDEELAERIRGHLDGWLRVTSEAVSTDAELERWVRIGTTYAGSLPPK